jgi:hypothetical protein
MRFLDTHPTDQELTRAADGELSARRASRLQRHLSGCWECRVRAQELEGAIKEFVHVYRRTLDPLLPPSSGRRALLKTQLEHIASAQPLFWKQLLVWRRRLLPLAGGALVIASASLIVARRWNAERQPAMYASFTPISFPATELTPGVARATKREQVCGSDAGKNRNVPAAISRKVFERYGMPGADPKAYEVDYLITPALGGADDLGNLWPQSYSATVWNARVKDALEDRLHELVCSGSLDLATAQREIATDWIAAYKKYFHTDRPLN